MRHSDFRVVPRVAVSAVAALVLALTLAACGGGDDATTAAAADTESAAEAGGTSNLTGVVWEWQGSSYSDDSSATPDDPSRYTIEFLDDGTASIKADCNQVQAQYTADGTSISITPGASTKVACPEDTLDFEFLLDLEGAATYAVDESSLRIDIKFDSGSMQFAPAP
jgi:heat shock protein HslJ